MRTMRWLIVLSLLLMPLVSYAVDWEIKSVVKDENRNLHQVMVDFIVDGEVITAPIYANTNKLLNMTSTERKEYVRQKIEGHRRSYVANVFFKKNSSLEVDLQSMIGEKGKETTADVYYYGLDDVIYKTIQIKEDGTYREVPTVITP